jgi:membrane protein implicated in regulation of membrane protease activity
MPDLVLLSVVAIVLLALVFDFTNGFHDAANSIATVVSTRVLTPRMAVIWAASFNFLAFFVALLLYPWVRSSSSGRRRAQAAEGQHGEPDERVWGAEPKGDPGQ